MDSPVLADWASLTQPQAGVNYQPPGYQPDELQSIRGAADQWDLGPLSGMGSPAGEGGIWRTAGRRVMRFNASPNNGCGWPNPAMFGAVQGVGRVPGELRFVCGPWHCQNETRTSDPAVTSTTRQTEFLR